MNKLVKFLTFTAALTCCTLSFAQTPQLASSWTGLYNDEQKISLFFQQKGDQLTGYGLLNGKQTKFKGSLQKSGSVYNKPKFFSLKAQQCNYAKDEGNYPEASRKLLKDADLQVALGELQYMRNEIYARHGYVFQNKSWAATFADYDWYMPCFTNVDSRLTKIEKENVKRIKMVEPYAKDVEWGR